MEAAEDGKEFINIALLDQISDADIKKIISDTDKWNVNISSRERMDIAYDRLDKLEEWRHEPQNYKTQCEAMEKRIEELEEKLGRVEDLNKRIDGLSYLVKQGINKKA